MPDNGWSFHLERIALNGLSLDAGERLGMVIVQPDYTLDADGAVPFRISAACRQAQRDLIERAFQIRAVEREARNVPVPFILFPEVSIPVHDPDGLDCLRQQMQEAEGEVVFIGGLEGLSRQEAQDLADRFPPAVDVTRPDFGATGAFVNVCIIAVKWADRRVAWHFQAKLAPSQVEQNRNMAHGGRVLFFDAPRAKFLCQICFDHIAAQGEESLNDVLCRKLIEEAHPDPVALDFVFVPQCNPRPDHAAVRQNTGRLLNYQDRAFKNDMTSVLVVNKAAPVQEPSEYGRSGFHYRAGRWEIPTSDIGPKGYELYDSDAVTSAIFRKRTQAIHVATLVPPSQNVGDSGNPRQPLVNPRSYLIADSCGPVPCSCLPGTAGNAGTFVECDCLPCKLRDSLLGNLPSEDTRNRWTASEADQSASLAAHYGEIRAQLLAQSCARAGELLDLLLWEYQGGKANPDTWAEPRPSAVVELVAALSVLREWMRPLDVETKPEWTALLGDSIAVVVLDGEDRKHDWQALELAYRRAFEDHYFRSEMRQRAVLFVALRSQGQVEPVVKPSWLDFAEPQDRARLGDTQSVAEPERLRFWVCQGGLLEQARREASIGGFLESKMGGVRG